MSDTPIPDNNKAKGLYIIDDERMFCELFCSQFDSHDTYTILGYALNGTKALEDLEKIKPDAVLIDIRLKNENGIYVAREVNRALPATTIIMLSGHLNETLIAQSMKAGARGFLPKTMTVTTMLSAIDTIMNTNSIYIDSDLGINVKDLMMNLNTNRFFQLSGRELEVLTLIVQEYSTKEIAEILRISEKTVRNHKSNIMNKLNIHTDAGLIKYALTMAIS